MPWFKVDDGLHSHPKWLAASPHARALWVTAGSWCAAQLTDGHIPRHVLPTLCGRPKDATELVRLGLWTETDTGWAFHDWDGYQPSAESVEAERAAARERQRRARAKARASRRDSHRDATADRTADEADCSNTATVPERKSRNGNGGSTAPDSRVVNLTTSTNSETSRRDSRVTDTVSHGPPDPTRPDPNNSKGGENSQAADPDVPPPRRCSTHQNWPTDATIPACGPCADARRAHTDWTRRHSNSQADNHDHRLDAQQRAAKARAERHLRAVNGEACPHCQDTGLTLDDNGTAITCNHPQAATP